jgi:tRNA dimethylallyltransferase
MRLDDLSHIISIIGPTASGKTSLACALAHEMSAEIISADSRQVFRYMDIGTGKDLEEYSFNGEQIPYHLIDILNPGEEYSAGIFQKDFIKAHTNIKKNGNPTILCGGSGMYIESALEGNTYLGIPNDKDLSKELSELSETKLDERFELISKKIKEKLFGLTRRRKIRAIIIDDYLKNNPNWKTIEMPKFSYTLFGIDIDRDERRDKITQRLSYRLNNGLIEEVEFLLENYLNHNQLESYGLEYKWIGRYLKKEISKKELFNNLNIAIHQFAKRQMTWFRRMEKNGYQIHWINSNQKLDDKLASIRSILETK